MSFTKSNSSKNWVKKIQKHLKRVGDQIGQNTIKIMRLKDSAGMFEEIQSL